MSEQINNVEKRVLVKEEKTGLNVQDIILVAVLLAAGAVLKFFVGSIINIGGMKPNFIIAMYCLAIMLIKPKLHEAGIIGILAGALCQFFPGTALINLASELLGALSMYFFTRLTVLKLKKFDLRAIIGTFVSTVISGSAYVALLFIVLNAEKSAMVAYVPIVLCTAAINCVIVQLLYLPIKAALKKD